MKEVCYTVRGAWPFPLDMLRHDGSRAASPEDQSKIDRYAADHAPDRSVFEPVEISLVGPHKPNTARWESFTWSVPADADYAMMKEHRARGLERKRLRDAALSKLSREEREALEWYAGKAL
ncbi:hypothetical protein [Chelativorans sp.]|uniref:hypothetical protein n=1 Tax=Chelativorans sp. TaxID=2203393 RepID=UPI002811DA8A|nr:hypothetical protein [Chelativorans sp.]